MKISGMAVLALLAVSACAPKRIHEDPILRNGDRVASADAAVEQVRTRDARERDAAVARRDSLAARAVSSCAPTVCRAVARGEVVIGMSEAQVLAATRTTEGAWTARDAGSVTVLVPVSLSSAPRDANGELGMVQFRDGLVATYNYREAQGVRVISEPGETTLAGRASATADMLLREGDDLVARGELNAGLDRYDRAHVLRAGDPQIEYRIATVLDKQLRPVEALVRYQLFLHQMELEKIKATGEAYGQLANAIAHARERVIILEKNR
jgi:hypothetical protein